MTLAVVTAIIFAFLLADGIVDAIRDVAMAKHEPPQYPRQDGNYIVLGPEIFTDPRADVICWKGVNYTPQEPKENSA